MSNLVVNDVSVIDMLRNHFVNVTNKELCAILSFLLPVEDLFSNIIFKGYNITRNNCISYFSSQKFDNTVFSIDIHGLNEGIRIKEVAKIENYTDMSFEEFVSCISACAKDYMINYLNNDSNNISNKEDTNMKANRLFPNLEFGKVTNPKIKMSHLGVAMMNNEGTYVAYDLGSLVDVNITSVDGDALFQIPVQFSDIKVGDCILHNNLVYCITSFNPLKGVSYWDGVEDEIKLTTNMFGFNFVTKIVSVFDVLNMGNLTGSGNMNMLPLLMLSKDKGFSNNTLETMLIMQMMQQSGSNQQTDMNNIFSNPLMLYTLMGEDSDMSTLLMMQMMTQQTTQNTAEKTEIKNEDDPWGE